MKFAPTLHKLSNGVTVILDPMDIETASVKIRFFTGARDEAPHEQGLTHFCEHMLCKGTTRFPDQKKASDYIDMRGGYCGASTSEMSLNFYGRIVADNINVLIDLLGDQIQNSLFLPEKIEIERTVISDEVRRHLDMSSDQQNLFAHKKLFNGVAFEVGGSLESIASFTRDQMLEFLSRRLSAKNCIIGISGKINDTDDILKQLEKTFLFLKQIDVSENNLLTYTPSVAHRKKGYKNDKLSIYFPHALERKFENRFDNQCVGKFEDFLRESIYETIRHQNGLVYNFSKEWIGNENVRINMLNTETSPENIEKCMALIAQTAYQVYTGDKITDADLDRFIGGSRLGQADYLESSNTRCDHLIGFYRDFGRLYDYYETIQMRESIRRDDVIKYSRGYFDGPMSIITQGPDYTGNLKEIWEDNFKSKSKFPKSLNLPEMPAVNQPSELISGEKCR